MLSLRNRFGIPGVIAVLALAFAMVGGTALAASSAEDASSSAKRKGKAKKKNRGVTVQQVRRIARQEARRFAGQGPVGPQGLPGVPGVPGEDGEDGDDGEDGSDGKDGATGATGPTGPTGPEGSPWTAGGTLPSGETLTGSWYLDNNGIRTAISFEVPLAAAIAAGNVHFVAPGGGGSSPCPGSEANPQADDGHLCVYGTFVAPSGDTPVISSSASAALAPGASKAGAIVHSTTVGLAFGTWAVTAP
jgi:hypothetical protein